MDVSEIFAIVAVFGVFIPALVFLVIFVVFYQKARGEFIKGLSIEEKALIARYEAISFLDGFRQKNKEENHGESH